MPNRNDGISRLDELMRYEQTLELPASAIPPPTKRRGRRRYRGAIIAGLVVLVLAASAGCYSAWALTTPIGAATLDSEAPPVVTPEAAQLDLGSDMTAGAVTLVSGRAAEVLLSLGALDVAVTSTCTLGIGVVAIVLGSRAHPVSAGSQSGAGSIEQ